MRYLLLFVLGFDQCLITIGNGIGQFVPEIFLVLLVPLRGIVLVARVLPNGFLVAGLELMAELVAFACHALDVVVVVLTVLTE